jgi:DNA processing protein
MSLKHWIALYLETLKKPKLFWLNAHKKNFPKITQEAEEFLKKHEENHIQIISWDSFPPSLKDIPDPPRLIFLTGDKESLFKPCIGIIGSRQGSLLARQWTQDLATALSQAGYTIVSGLAKGIDAAAHVGSSSTIGVVAGGVDYIYPQENKLLFERIPNYGCVISEEPMQTKAQASFFPKRNRIIAALSQVLVVVEAASGSGSLITVNAALEYGKSIFVVPGPPWDTRYGASLALLRNGASFCTNAQDILSFMRPLTFSDRKIEKQPLILPGLSKKDLLSLLSASPVQLSDLYESYDPIALIRLISELEVEGAVIKSGDKVMLLS